MLPRKARCSERTAHFDLSVLGIPDWVMAGWIPRIHLFELEDQAWFPAVIRDLATDYLRAFEERFGFHRHALPILETALRETGATHVVDLCSGGGGPIVALHPELVRAGLPLRVTLTDLFPNLAAFEEARESSGGQIRFIATPIDARSVPEHVEGFRTIFNAFHHFNPEDARGILQDAAEAGRPIGVFEIPERTLRMLLGVVLQPVLVWLFTLTIRPLGWKRIVWTYLLPAVPLTCLWDGFVSMLRAYSVDELTKLAEEVEVPDYRWRAGEYVAPSVHAKLTYLLGRPVHTG